MTGFRHKIKQMDATMWLVAINAAIFLTITLTGFATRIADNGINIASAFFDLPSGAGVFLRPWSLLTYMFVQTDVWHLIFNMLWLYWFGKLYEQLTTGKKLIYLYIIGGIAGGLAFITAGAAFPGLHLGYLEGASAAVMAVVAATACTVPDMKLNLVFIGGVKIKWIALGTLAIFGLGLTGSNAGGHIAHIGGLAAGALWCLVLKLRRPRYDKVSPRKLSESEARAELDYLLDKVKRSGYGSLTRHERQRLVELSRQV